MKQLSPTNKRIGKIAASSAKAARRLPVPTYAKPNQWPAGTPGASTVSLPKPRRFKKENQ